MPVQWTQKKQSPSAIRNLVRREVTTCLKDTARYVQAKASKYPPQKSGWYRRTRTLGRSISFGDVTFTPTSAAIEVGTNLHYARYVEEGTGLWGPRRRAIRPVAARVLHWQVTGALRGVVGPDFFALSSSGMQPWWYMRTAFTDRRTQAYFQARQKQLLAALAAQL